MVGYDNPYWEYHLPVNPPGAYFREGFDVRLDSVDIVNWKGADGTYEFQPRLRDNVQLVSRDFGLGLAADDDASEIDFEYADEGYDCD